MEPLTPEEERELIETRRDLHAHPETAFEEKRTARVVAERLESLGLSPRTGIAGTGLTASIDSGIPGKRVLLRADIDALPIEEESDEPYRSTAEGAMHACGHDGHTAILLTAARLFLRLGIPAAGSVELLFQPAEETAGGAKAMIDAGVLDERPVDAAFGLHLWNSLDVGKIAAAVGPVMAAADEFAVRVAGTGCHGARPQDGRDPVPAAAAVVTALQQIASRRTDPLASLVVTVGSIHGGNAFNVIPEEVILRGTIRCFDHDLWETIPSLFAEVAKNAARAMGCEAEIDYIRSARPVVNDAALTRLVRETAADLVGEDHVVEERTMGAEDFGEFLHRVPGCFFFVGSKNEALGKDEPHHSPRFDIDESALSIGVRMLGGLVERYFRTAERRSDP